jgi:acetyltransferase-like isoleucine patch superfamily enzyme
MTSFKRRVKHRLRWMPRNVGYFWAPAVASFFRKKWVLLRNPHADIRFGKHVYLGPGFSLHAPFASSFHIGSGVEFRRDFRCELAADAKLAVGAETRFTYGVLIQCGQEIQIGQRCMFGQTTALFDGNHKFRDLNLPMLEQGYDLRPLHIADDAVVTTKCTVLANIGERTFVGANSVVARDLPAYVLAVGAPAEPIDYFGPAAERPDELPASRPDRSG